MTNLLWDLDGTLTDSSTGIINCFNHALRTLSQSELDPTVITAMIGTPLPDMFRQVGIANSEVTKAVDAFHGRYVDKGLYENELIPGIVDALTALHQSGHAMAIATSKPTTEATRIVEHFGIHDRFVLVSGSLADFSRITKTDVIGYALNTLQWQPDQTVMIGDRRDDVVGAASNNMRAIGVTWGFGGESEFHAPNVITIAHQPSKLADYLLRTERDPGLAP